MVRWTLRQALICLIGSTTCTLVIALSSYTLWTKAKRQRLQDPAHRITAIVQTGPEKEALKTIYLA